MGKSGLRAPRVGRPRLLEVDSALSGRGQILDAAAALFTELGFAATSTRAIADRVGIKQASIYYHFTGKDEILIELLTTSVRPSLDFIRQLEDLVPGIVSASGALFALTHVDVQTLRETPHNVGTLYLLPEVQHERYEAFRRTRTELQDTYGRLGHAAAAPHVAAAIPEPILGALLIQLVEVVIQLRREGRPVDAAAIEASSLRLLGLGEDDIDRAREESLQLLSDSNEAILSEGPTRRVVLAGT